IQNPDDSVSLQRVINTPARGIGKTTLETLEHLALETGVSIWGAMGEAIRRQLLPARALAALKGFKEIIEDARAMLAGTYGERAEQTAQPTKDVPAAIAVEQEATDFGPLQLGFERGSAGASPAAGAGIPPGSRRGAGATALKVEL